MAALGYEYGCVGLRIWLRWVTDTTPLANGDVSFGLSRYLRQLIEPLESAD